MKGSLSGKKAANGLPIRRFHCGEAKSRHGRKRITFVSRLGPAWHGRWCRPAHEGVQAKPQNTLAYNVTHTPLNLEVKIVITTRPTPLQAKAFERPGLNPACTQ